MDKHYSKQELYKVDFRPNNEFTFDTIGLKGCVIKLPKDNPVIEVKFSADFPGKIIFVHEKPLNETSSKDENIDIQDLEKKYLIYLENCQRENIVEVDSISEFISKQLSD